MVDILQFANNANTTVASPINTVVTSVTVLTGTGTEFPTPSAGFSFLATFVDAATKSIYEIVRVTAKSVDTFTIQRAQEGTTAQSWIAGDLFQMMPTAGTMAAFSQIPQTQASAYNVSVDTGTTNSLVAAFTPPITTHIQGLTLRIKAANSNNSACTLNAGAGSAPIVNPDGSALGQGAIIGGGYIEVIDDAANGNYQLISSSQQAQSSAGAATTGDMKFRPTSETITGWVIANATTIGNASSNATQLASATAANLFAWHWTNFSNTQCPVFTSGGSPTTRGANAAADFAANKAIKVLDERGKGQLGMDTMGGSTTTLLNGVTVVSGNATTPGSILGENLHTLITNELASHTHSNTLSDPGHSHGISDPGHFHNTFGNYAARELGIISTGGGSAIIGVQLNNGNDGTMVTQTVGTGISINGATTGISINNAAQGGGAAHNTVHLSMIGTWYLKL